MNRLQKIAVSGSTLALMLSSAPVIWGATIDMTGAESVNKVIHTVNCVNTVSQANYSTVTNSISVNQNTGGNSASMNTGSASISTGDVSAGVLVVNAGNSNELSGTDSCCCGANEHSSEMVSNTGYDSKNIVKTKTTMTMSKVQKNKSLRSNLVGVNQSTGYNKAKKNTHDAEVSTGAVEVVVEVQNEGDSNTN